MIIRIYFLKLKGIEYLNFMGKIYDVEPNILRANIIEYSRKFGMEEVLNDKIESYSHGMRQKNSYNRYFYSRT